MTTAKNPECDCCNETETCAGHLLAGRREEIDRLRADVARLAAEGEKHCNRCSVPGEWRDEVNRLRALVESAYREGFDAAPEDWHRASTVQRDADRAWRGSKACATLDDVDI